MENKMKIFESYKKIAKSMLLEYAWDRKFGEPLPTLEDVMKEAEVDDEKMIKYKDKDGETKQMKVGSAKTMEKDHPAKQAWDKMADKGGEEEPKGKGLGKGDFERDFGGDTGTDADYQGEPPEGAREPDDEEKEGWDNVEDFIDASHEDILDDPQSILNAFDDIEQAGLKVPDWMYDKAGGIKNGNGDENDAEEIQSAIQNMYDRPEDYKESITINGKQYREVTEHAWDRKFGEPLPTLADVMKVKEEKKVTKKHILREMYERIGGK
jgi:hypothetical protein